MVTEGDEAGRRSRLTSVSGFHDAREASGPVRPGGNAGTGGQPCSGGRALRRPKAPTHRACSLHPPGCCMMSAGAACCDG